MIYNCKACGYTREGEPVDQTGSGRREPNIGDFWLCSGCGAIYRLAPDVHNFEVVGALLMPVDQDELDGLRPLHRRALLNKRREIRGEPDPEQNEEQLMRLVKEMEAAGNFGIMFRPKDAFATIAALQIAMRHPDLNVRQRASIEDIADTLQRALREECPFANEILDLGWRDIDDQDTSVVEQVLRATDNQIPPS